MKTRLAAGVAAVLAAGVLTLYLGILRAEQDQAPWWVLALFGAGICSAVVAAIRGSRPAALVGLVSLGPLALVSLLSIGMLLVPSVVLLVLSYGVERRTGTAPP